MRIGDVHYFPRDGDGPLISVIIPTRGHPSQLCESIDSMHSLAHEKHEIEYLLKIDDDDQPTIDVFHKLESLIPIRALISPRGRGYLDFHHWVNELSLNWAKGSWIFLGNDDGYMVNEGWDRYVSGAAIDANTPWHGCTDVCLFICQTLDRPEASEFNFVRRKTIEILGHYSLNAHCDNWVATVLSAMTSAYRIPVQVRHENIDDEIRKQVLEDYRPAGKDMNSMANLRAKFHDMYVLADYVEKWQQEHSDDVR